MDHRARVLQQGKDGHWALGSHLVIEDRYGVWPRGAATAGDEKVTLAVRRVRRQDATEDELQVAIEITKFGKSRQMTHSGFMKLTPAIADILVDAIATDSKKVK